MRNIRLRLAYDGTGYVGWQVQPNGTSVQSCLESAIEQLTGTSSQVIHVVGGGSQNSLLNQLTADAANIRVVAGPAEATASGNILVQAIAAGAVKDLAEARQIVRNSFDTKTFEPNPSEAIEAARARFDQL